MPVNSSLPPLISLSMADLLSVIQRLRSCLLDRIHVDTANARVTDFKILRFVPPYLQSYEHRVFQLCALIVNL